MEVPEGMMDAPETSKEMAPDEVCIPLKALGQPDDSEEMQTPEAGDNVTMTVDAVVTRIEGDKAYVKPVSVNGTDLSAEKTPEPDADVMEGNSLWEEASQMSKYV